VFVGYYLHLTRATISSAPSVATARIAEYTPKQFHKVLSTQEKKHVLDGQFTTVRSTQKMPQSLKLAFAAATGQRQFALANPGQKYQVTDVILEPGLPFRRLMFAGESGKDWFIHYEHGGIGHNYAVLVFREGEGRVQLRWGGAGSEGARDLDDLRKKIAAGDFRDDAVYYW
jgi:hypothetical protein